MNRKAHAFTVAALLALAASALVAVRSAPAPEPAEGVDPASMRIEYRPGGYMPADFPLHGKVRLLTSPLVEMGRRTRVKIEYSVGDLPIEEGESLEIWKHFTSDVEEFQTNDADEPAFFGVETTAPGVELETRRFTNYVQRNKPSVFPYRKTAGVTVTKGRLSAGDKVFFDLGGRKGVRMQFYEENLFNFRVVIVRAWDGKVLGYGGDAVMKVVGAELAKLRVHAPSIVSLGEDFTVEVIPQDEWGSLARNYQGVELRMVSGNVAASPFEYEPDLTHYVARKVVANQEGVVRIEVRTKDGSIGGLSNPIRVERHARRRVFYGDLHQHTYLHDGRGVYEELYLYARRMGLLDFGSITPHHIPLGISGPRFYLDGYSDARDHWPELVLANKIMKGWKGFTPILGYEYSVGTRSGGHHNVIYNADDAPTVMQLDPNRPRAPVGEMLKTLRRAGVPTLVIPHVGGGPPDWEHPTDPRTERLFEIASVHGVFEESWRKHLESGQRLAATASADNHTTSFGNSYPGLIYTMTNPLTGVYAYSNSRDDIWNGLYERRTFAVTGNTRMLVDFAVNGEPMGGELARGLNRSAKISARVSGTAPLTKIEIVKNRSVIHAVYPSRNRGRMLRVVWGDNIYQRRANIALSDGELSAASGVIRLMEVLHRDQQFERVSQSGARITWRTAATSGDRDGVLVDISDVSGDSLRFHLEDPHLGTIETEIPLAKLNEDGFFAWTTPGEKPFEHPYMKKMGVPVTFFLECELVNAAGPLDYELTYEDREPLQSGDYYYLRIEQLDTNKAWTSPVWVN